MKLSKPIFWFAFLMAIGIASLTTSNAQAHGRVEVGPYTIVIGWTEEPVIVGERNAILLEIYEDDRPVTGAEGTLNVEIEYAGRTFGANIVPIEAGIYHVPLFPTRRGQFMVNLTGTIEDTPVDEVLEPEEVLSAAVLHFPETEPDTFALADEVAALQAQLASARTLAFVGIGLGVLGLIAGIFAITRKK